MPDRFLPPFPDRFEDTRATLHAYARAVGAIPRAHGVAHPRWWHISLKPRPEGLATDAVPLPDGGALGMVMDLARHRVVMTTTTGAEHTFDLRSGATGTEFGEQLIAAAADHGLEGGYDRDRFRDDRHRAYDPAAATALSLAFASVATAFERHRAGLGVRVGPIQVWPHGFDIAFEWFGTRLVPGEGDPQPAQINLGWYPEGRAYFYSNPWPFDDSLMDHPLPHGAAWHIDGWQGSILYSDRLASDPNGTAKLLDYARAVHAAAAPALDA